MNDFRRFGVSAEGSDALPAARVDLATVESERGASTDVSASASPIRRPRVLVIELPVGIALEDVEAVELVEVSQAD